MVQKDKRYRGFNEIYFVLYLTAILLLLPEGKKIYDDYIVSDNNRVYIKAEKSMLNVRLKVEQGKSVVISADTINIIYPVGKIDSIKYDFKLNSNNISNTIYTSNQQVNSNAFRVIENDEGIAFFSWTPRNINTINKNFEVFVDAEIYAFGKEMPQISSLRFAINTFFIDELEIASNKNDEFNNLSQNQFSTENIQSNSNTQIILNSPLSSIVFFPENPVSAIALSRWKSIVRVFGIDLTKDLKYKPKIIANVEYDIKIDDIDNNAIYLSGLTSSSEEYKVSIEIERNQDSRIASTDFVVKPIMLQFPDYPKIMYPNYNYTFKPNLPQNSNNSFTAKLIYNDKIIANSENGSAFKFIPQFDDTNKVIKFNRYYDDKLIDSKDNIRIVSPPIPEITKKSFSNGVLTITTKSYGKLNNDGYNVVSKLVFDNQNIRYQDLTGETQYLDNFTIQVFRITLQDNIRSLNVSAIDERGIYSKPSNITF
jgi:hypothetical protein